MLEPVEYPRQASVDAKKLMKTTDYEIITLENPVFSLDVPYRPIGLVQKVGEEPEVLYPAYVNHIRNCKWSDAIRSLRRERAMELLALASSSYRTWTGFIRSCSSLESNTFAIDPNGSIVVNENWANSRAVDQDGDWGSVPIIDNSKEGPPEPPKGRANSVMGKALAQVGIETNDGCSCLIKHPFTMHVPILKQVPWTPSLDKYYSFSLKDWASLQTHQEVPNYSREDQWEMYEKNHAPNLVGPLTNAHNAAELYDSQNMDYLERLDYLFSLPERHEDIELGQLRAMRKEGKEVETNYPILLRGIVIDPEWRPCLSSKRTVMRSSDAALAAIDSYDSRDYVERLRRLHITFGEPQPKEEFKLNNTKPPTNYFNNGDMVGRLKAVGALQIAEVPHHLEGYHSCVMRLTDGYGHPVALVDTKRHGSVGYTFRVPPVVWWDGEHVMLSNPEDYLNTMFTESNFAINSQEYGYRGMWPRTTKDLQWYNTKSTLAQNAIQKFVSSFGLDVVESDHLEIVGKFTIGLTIAVDYSTWPEAPALFMAKIVEAFEKTFGVIPCYAGGKSSNPDVRKYVLARLDGTPLTVPEGKPCNPRRCGNILSQLSRSAVLKDDMTVAVVSGINYNKESAPPRNKTQVLITPTGIDKQRFKELFMERVSLIMEPGQDDKESDFTGIKEVHKMDGSKGIVYTAPPKAVTKIGKLVDRYGNKFVPGETLQATLKDGTPIDLIFPVQEMLAKDNAHALLENAREEVMEWNGQTLTVLVITARFFRTTAASENLPARRRITTARGIDGKAIERACRKIGVRPIKSKPDYSFADGLLTTIDEILEWTAGE